MANLTDERILLDTDYYCPVCGSSNIVNDDSGDAYQYDIEVIHNNCICNDCHSSFTFSYWVRDAFITEDNYNKED